ncbi:MAG: DUF4011 domain-containing protein, partial [Phycisphaerales bacterium]
MSVSETGLLAQMLDRLFAAIARGPSIDCRPANSRQRLDLTELAALGDLGPEDIIAGLMSDAGTVRLTGTIERPPAKHAGRGHGADAPVDPPAAFGEAPVDSVDSERGSAPSGPERTGDAPVEPGTRPNAGPDTGDASDRRHEAEVDADPPKSGPSRAAMERAWTKQQAVLRKLRHIAEEARTYEEDTGVYVLNVGFPLLHLPRHTNGGGPRVLAPLAFVPVQLKVSSGVRPVVELTCRYSGEDRVVPNQSLLSWVERQTGQSAEDLFSDAEGVEPWRELQEIVGHVCRALELEPPASLAEPSGGGGGEGEGEGESEGDGGGEGDPPTLTDFQPAPGRNAEGEPRAIVHSAVIGLFPVSNQGLLRDTQHLVAEPEVQEPLKSFLSVNPSVATAADDEALGLERRRRSFAEERFVQLSDPCQARAVRLAREVGGLVVHGPPGTGKSQTITNIIGDHLARGERVLFVCEKRTAIDVVANRLQHVGLGDLCAVIHDVKRDQRDLYMAVRKQLEELSETYPRPKSERDVNAIDRQLQGLHDELQVAWRALMVDEDADDASGIPDLERAGRDGSFHHLVGQWLAIDSAVELPIDHVRGVSIEDVDASQLAVEGILERGLETEYGSNPWPGAAGLSLEDLISTPADHLRARLDACVEAASAADATRVEGQLPFRPEA